MAFYVILIVMKIGLVCPYNLFKGGGVQECVFALQKGLIARGHDAYIITPLPWGRDNPKLEGVIFVGNATQVKSFHTTSQLSISVNIDMVDSILSEQQFDVLHFHEPWVPIVSMQILSRSKSANIATFHAKLPGTVMTRTIERVITPYTKSIMKYVHELTAVSPAAAEYVRSLTKKPISIVPNGVDLEKYRVDNAGRVSVSSKRVRTILYVGRLEKRKGVGCLLRAYRQMVNTNPRLRLIIAGEGVDRRKLEEYVTENNLPNVIFKGYVTDEEKIHLLHQADLFCSPALYGESFGIVLLEAMACGVVTVAGNNPGYSEVLKERGSLSLVNPKDVDDFARRVELMLYDDDIRTLWRAWAAEYVQQFNYNKIVSQYEQLYRRAMEKHE